MKTYKFKLYNSKKNKKLQHQLWVACKVYNTMGIYCKETTAQFEVANMADNLNGNINYTFMEYK